MIYLMTTLNNDKTLSDIYSIDLLYPKQMPTPSDKINDSAEDIKNGNHGNEAVRKMPNIGSSAYPTQ